MRRMKKAKTAVGARAMTTKSKPTMGEVELKTAKTRRMKNRRRRMKEYGEMMDFRGGGAKTGDAVEEE